MNFKSVFQAFSSALQSNTTALPPILTTPTQNRTSLPIPEAILIELDLLDQDQDHATSRQSISTTQPPIPTTSTQQVYIQDSDDQELPDLAQAQGWAIARQSISTAPPPIPAIQVQQNTMPLPPPSLYPSKDALFEAIQAWARPHGYAFTTGKSKKAESGRIKVYYACDRCRPMPSNIAYTCIRHTQSHGIGCLFSVLACELPEQQGWELKHRPEYKFSTHNHAPSPHSAAHPSYRRMPSQVLNLNQRLYTAGKYKYITNSFNRSCSNTSSNFTSTK